MSSLFGEEPPENDSPLFGDSLPPAEATDGVHYRVLARKYRPTKFSELVGQDVLVRTLTNAFSTGRLAHAWMMTGVRGVGKTTTARIIAKALNCTGPDGSGGPTVEPCGVCPSCVAISQDRCVDVLEVDAASRTGVDDMREILDGVRYAPVMCRTKIYIIDEVHMLSKHAFNALLKTLEEPPSHVKFIFATTEIRKVPVTVLSRCQRFDLRRIPSETLFQYFTEICSREGIAAEPEAIRLIARAADGSARDGLSLLDQAIATANDASVAATDVQNMLGLADRSHLVELVAAITNGAPDQALAKFQDMVAGGADALTTLQDIADLIHLLTRGKIITTLVTDPNLSEIERIALQRLLPSHLLGGLTRLWQIILKGIGEVQSALRPVAAAEMVLVRLAYAATLPAPAELLERFPAATPPASPAPSGGGSGNFNPAPSGLSGGAAKSLKVVGGGTITTTTAVAAPATQTQSAPQISEMTLALASDYQALVNKFLDMREVTLHTELYGNVQLVSLAPGRLEIIPHPTAPRDLAARVGNHLTNWTGDRWVVALATSNSAPDAAPTLAEQERTAKATLRAEALASPLVQAVLKAFPGATLTEIKPRPVAAVAEIETSDDDIASDVIIAAEEEEF